MTQTHAVRIDTEGITGMVIESVNRLLTQIGALSAYASDVPWDVIDSTQFIFGKDSNPVNMQILADTLRETITRYGDRHHNGKFSSSAVIYQSQDQATRLGYLGTFSREFFSIEHCNRESHLIACLHTKKQVHTSRNYFPLSEADLLIHNRSKSRWMRSIATSMGANWGLVPPNVEIDYLNLFLPIKGD